MTTRLNALMDQITVNDLIRLQILRLTPLQWQVYQRHQAGESYASIHASDRSRSYTSIQYAGKTADERIERARDRVRNILIWAASTNTELQEVLLNGEA